MRTKQRYDDEIIRNKTHTANKCTCDISSGGEMCETGCEKKI